MLLLLIAVVLLAGFVVAGFTGAPWVPAFRRDVMAMINDTGLKGGELFVELGCGDGRLIMAAAKKGARVIGYEINPLLWLIAVIRNLRYYPRVKIKLGNFWSRDLSGADVVMTFLMPKFMHKLENKAKAEMKPGARLISYIYELPNQKPSQKGARWTIYTF